MPPSSTIFLEGTTLTPATIPISPVIITLLLYLSADIKSLTMIAPATQENIAKAEHFEPDARVYAISSEAAENIWLALTGDKDEDRVLIFFESDERSLDLLKSVNPYAFSKKI